MVKTKFGDVPLWGRIEAGKPLVFVVRGAFPEPDHLSWLTDELPQYSVALAHLPGMCGTPFIADYTPATYGRAFDEILAMFAGPTVVLGVSIGGVAALAMRSPHIAGRVLIDTPLQTAGLWPIVSGLRRGAALSPQHSAWVDALFGVTANDVVNRDYRAMARRGDRVLVGDIPLGVPRELGVTPSLVADTDRTAYVAAGALVGVVRGCGHDIPQHGRAALMDALHHSLSLGAGALGDKVAS